MITIITINNSLCNNEISDNEFILMPFELLEKITWDLDCEISLSHRIKNPFEHEIFKSIKKRHSFKKQNWRGVVADEICQSRKRKC